jgi:ATP-dependent Clp protease ATP-binding subunit ClpA
MATCKEKEKVEHQKQIQDLHKEYESKIKTLQEQIDELTKQLEKQSTLQSPSTEPGKRTFTEAQVASIQDQFEEYVRNLKFTVEVYKKVSERIIEYWDNQKNNYLEQIKSLEYDVKSQKDSCKLYKETLYKYFGKGADPKPEPEESKPEESKPEESKPEESKPTQPVFIQENKLPSDA